MNTRSFFHRIFLLPLLLSLVLSACQPIQPPPPGPQLATARVSAQLSNQPGRAIVSARGNHFVVDSVPPLEGPNEEVNPLDMLLGALATCGIFVAERAAQEQELPLMGATARVEGDLDPRGVAGEPVDPRIQAMRVYLDLDGVNEEETAVLVEQFLARCPIYTTLSQAAPIEVITGDEVATAPAEGLSTASVTAMLSNQPGRAIVTARGNHFVIDSVPPLQGPNEERNPLDLMLGALATCGGFVFERVAHELNIPLTSLTALVEGDFDPRGVAGQPVSPSIQAIRINLQLQGVDEAQAAMMTEQFQHRCPIYTTLERATPIEVTTTIS
jgi:putative redox protein